MPNISLVAFLQIFYYYFRSKLKYLLVLYSKNIHSNIDINIFIKIFKQNKQYFVLNINNSYSLEPFQNKLLNLNLTIEVYIEDYLYIEMTKGPSYPFDHSLVHFVYHQ